MSVQNKDDQVLPVDLTEVLERVNGDREFLKELFNDLINDYPKQLKVLSQGIETRNFGEIVYAAHNLKGTTGALAANNARELAFKLEQMGRDEQLENAQEVLDKLKKELQRVNKWIKDYFFTGRDL
ncbi:MAG: Hpt domain-containing protein [bacterium]